jgi:hypothetical protein
MVRTRRSRESPYRNSPDLLTTFNTVGEKFRKFEWNFDRYEDAILKRPCDPDQVMFTALDLCVAATALRDWAKLRFVREVREGRSPQEPLRTEEDALACIYKEIRWQGAMDSIARALKHGTYDDASWPKGVAFPATFMPGNLQSELDSLSDGLEVLRYMHANRDKAWWDINLMEMGATEGTPGYIAFGDAVDDWQALLKRWSFLQP